MFKFFNKRERSVTGEQDVRRIDPIIQNKAESLLDFYKQNQELFQGYFDGEHNQQTKKTLIRDVYDTIGYTKPTQTTKPEKSSLQLYRGLRADTGSDILKYTDDFVKGEVVFGKKASLHGTGIYMTTNPDIANKYAQYDNSFGSVLSCQVKNDINIIKQRCKLLYSLVCTIFISKILNDIALQFSQFIIVDNINVVFNLTR